MKRACLLTEDQRWLLFAASPGCMDIALVDPDYGIPLLRERRGGGAWPAGCRDMPEWLRSYDTIGRGLAGGVLGESPHTVVTWTQLRHFANSIADDTRAELAAAYNAADGETRRAAMLRVLNLTDGSPRQLELFGTSV
jgi:hypothetical protein